jgi:spore coat protein CotF
MKKLTDELKTLLQGAPYVPAAKTDITKTFRQYGWIPPSTLKEQQDADVSNRSTQKKATRAA